MRGLAYGILDPDGERYRLALIHHGECPACRAYVVSLRGLAAVLPRCSCPGGSARGCSRRPAPPGTRVPGSERERALVRRRAPVSTAGAGSQAGVGIGGGLSASGLPASWRRRGQLAVGGGPLSAKLAVGVSARAGGRRRLRRAERRSRRDGNPLRAHHHAHPARADGAVQPAGDASLSEICRRAVRSSGTGRGEGAPELSGAADSRTAGRTRVRAREQCRVGRFSTHLQRRPVSPAKSAAFESRSLTAEDATTTAPPHSVGRSSTEQAGARASAAEREFGVG